MTKLVAFLRGVNLGKRRMTMDALRQSFADAGFAGARTLPKPEADQVELPTAVPGDFAFLGKIESAIFAVAWRMENGRFGAGMDKFAKPFGHTITNRNWNTVNRLIALSEKP